MKTFLEDSPDREARRLALFDQFSFLTNDANETLEEVCHLACGLFRVAHSHVALLGSDSGYYLTQQQVGRRTFVRRTSFTQRVFEKAEITVIQDSRKDPDFRSSNSFHKARFLAAAPLWVEPGLSLGVLSIFDPEPRALDADALSHFRRLSTLVVNELKRQRGIRDLRDRELLLTNARDEANAANVAKSAFLATMSHEIRTPLNGVLGMAQALIDDDLKESQRERVNTICQSGSALLTILNDILDLAKIESGKLEIERISFHLETVIERVMETFKADAQSKSLQLRMVSNISGEGHYWGDPTRIRQIVANLVSNAIKFTESGGVTVTVAGGTAVTVTVCDTGPGIPAEKISNLFEKFTQADTSTTRRYGGTGLGLAISRNLAELMGGTLTATSRVSHGSTFMLSLPLERAVPDAGSPSVSTSSSADYSDFRLLAAEDNPINQRVLQALVQPLGIAPLFAENGAQAVLEWETGHWDLILMDIQMPVMDGREATAKIREREAETGRERTPIIALTADSMHHQTASYKFWGLDGFLTKPIVNAQLRELIASYRKGAVSERKE